MAQIKKQKIPAPPRKKQPDQPDIEEGLPLWMATFADMVTLLLCFFVLLLSFAQQDLSNFKTLMGSIKDAFGVQVRRPEDNYAAYAPSRYERKDMELSQENKRLMGMLLQFQSLVSENEKLKKTTTINPEENGLVIRVYNDALFDPGSAKLKPDVGDILQHIIMLLKEYNYNLVVRGHTDGDEGKSNLFPSNWELSAARAAAALRYILEKGEISPNRLKAVGYSDSMPLVPPNTNDKNQTINRRTEFFFHHPEVKSY